jgi:hypothetical protein
MHMQRGLTLFVSLAAIGCLGLGCAPKLTEAERKAGKPASANFTPHQVAPPPGYNPMEKPAALREKLAKKAKPAGTAPAPTK